MGIFAKAPIRFELQLEPATLGLRAGGFAVYGAITRSVCSWGGGVSVRPADGRPGVVLSLDFQLLRWRISAGYSTGGYPPVVRMPHVDPDAGLTRRNTSHNRHAGISPRMAPGEAVGPTRPTGAVFRAVTTLSSLGPLTPQPRANSFRKAPCTSRCDGGRWEIGRQRPTPNGITGCRFSLRPSTVGAERTPRRCFLACSTGWARFPDARCLRRDPGSDDT